MANIIKLDSRHIFYITKLIGWVNWWKKNRCQKLIRKPNNQTVPPCTLKQCLIKNCIEIHTSSCISHCRGTTSSWIIFIHAFTQHHTIIWEIKSSHQVCFIYHICVVISDIEKPWVILIHVPMHFLVCIFLKFTVIWVIFTDTVWRISERGSRVQLFMMVISPEAFPFANRYYGYAAKGGKIILKDNQWLWR